MANKTKDGFFQNAINSILKHSIINSNKMIIAFILKIKIPN